MPTATPGIEWATGDGRSGIRMGIARVLVTAVVFLAAATASAARPESGDAFPLGHPIPTPAEEVRAVHLPRITEHFAPNSVPES